MEKAKYFSREPTSSLHKNNKKNTFTTTTIAKNNSLVFARVDVVGFKLSHLSYHLSYLRSLVGFVIRAEQWISKACCKI